MEIARDRLPKQGGERARAKEMPAERVEERE